MRGIVSPSRPGGLRVAPGPPGACPVCSQTLAGGTRCPNRWCARSDRVFSVVFAAATYDGAVRRAVVRHKYRGERWLAGHLGRLLAQYVAEHATWFEDFDLLLTTPAYLGPGSRRDWDPVAEIAGAAEGALGPGWSWETGVVIKRVETPPLQGRLWSERRAIAEGPLRAALDVPDPSVVDGSRVLVTDDVFTEGSTLREIAIALRRAGALEVAGLAIARHPWRNDRAVGRTPVGRLGPTA